MAYGSVKEQNLKQKFRKKTLEGIGGWLLVYFMVLFLSILNVAAQISATFHNKDIFLVIDLITLLVGIGALITLLYKKSIAVKFNLAYLFYNIFTALIVIFLVTEFASQMIVSIAVNFMWIMYWIYSERVRNTFG